MKEYMKTKFLLGTCALAACFVGCQNDEYLMEQIAENGGAESGKVIGADLVSHGMTIALPEEGPATRVNADGWQIGDQLGLAWYQFSKTAISEEQSESAWNSTLSTTYNKLYANHIFSWDGATFGTVADVYQGAYFVYFPYERLGGAVEKEIDVNAEPQKGTFEEERYNKALHISAQDFISKDEAVDENNKLTKEFYMSPVVNVLGVKATPGEEIANATGDGEYLKGMTITQMQLKANDAVFKNDGILVPGYIPKVVRDAKTGAIDYEKTREAMDEAAADATTSKGFIKPNTGKAATTTLTTNVENPEYTLADVREVRAFALPVQDGVTYASDRTNPTASITVGRLKADGTLDYALGTFTVDVDNSEKFIKKLRDALDADKTDEAISLTKILRDGNNGWSALRTDMVANLKLADFKPATTSIKTLEQWNDLVKLYDALVAVQGVKNVVEPTFNIAATITFDGAIAAPKNKDFNINVTTSSDKVKMLIKGETEWPANLTAVRTGSRAANIEVAEGAVLKFNPEAGEKGEGKALDANIVNKGVIEAGAYASIGTEDDKALDNTDGRVVVEFGAYVYPASDAKEGEIAYEVTNASPSTIGKINTLITKTSTTGQKGYAQVNTLVVSTTLDLNAEATEGSDDRYETENAETLKDLSAIAIELNNGAIQKVLEGTNSTVASVKAVGGENLMKSVQTENITVEEGTLTIDAVVNKDKSKTPLTGVKEIYNEANLNVEVDVEVESVVNYGKIMVGEDYEVTYNTLQQTNPETGEKGSFTGNVVPADNTPEIELLENAVKKAWSDLQTAGKFTTYDTMIANIKANSGDPLQTEFMNVLNAWRKYYNLAEVKAADLTAEIMKNFEQYARWTSGLN